MHDKTEDDKEAFYLLLEKIYDACTRSDIKVLLGDMNAQIGKEHVCYPIIWQHNLHNISNGNGRRLIRFTASRGTVIVSNLFCHKNIYKGTRKDPCVQMISLIDHVLIAMRHKSSLMDVRSFRGLKISDPFLVMSKFCSRISNCKRRKAVKLKRCDINKLEGIEVSSQYRQETNREVNRFEEKLTKDFNEQ
jgi:hypothetical protein